MGAALQGQVRFEGLHVVAYESQARAEFVLLSSAPLRLL